ncbi:unnamed protein product [Brachionus calyciflorus]|uniref:Uncharacterized protein n=1 Tax=Brachionus calyciflorus TaxID=104777 RepID=A0A813WS05_9BILA|nr:unnamed protein product [Brachionus calyciflorus]
MFSLRKQSKPLDLSMDLNHLNQINWHIRKSNVIIIFYNHINGFSLENNSLRIKQKNFTLSASFIELKFAFYQNNHCLKTCNQMKNFTSILNTVNFYLLELYRLILKRSICPLVFFNSTIRTLSMWPVYDTFYLKNKIIFQNTEMEVNSQIRELFVNKAIKLKIDENFLNKKLFKYIEKLTLYGDIYQIKEDTLSGFDKLKIFVFDAENFRLFVHRTLLKWLNSFNTNVKIDPNNLSQIKENFNKLIRITIVFSNYTSINHTFPDEDFCLYKDFPFDRMIFILFDNYPLRRDDNPPITCTAIWTIHIPAIYSIHYDMGKLYENTTFYNSFLGCEFEKKIPLCFRDKKLIKINIITRAQIEYICFFLMQMFGFGLIPLVSCITMILNWITYYIISKLDIKKNFKIKKLFYYIKINAIVNILICFIGILRMVYT